MSVWRQSSRGAIYCMCAKELLAESERAVSATVPHRRGLRHWAKA